MHIFGNLCINEVNQLSSERLSQVLLGMVVEQSTMCKHCGVLKEGQWKIQDW